MHTADIIVAGAGHNSLITAAYMVKAGMDVIVLDARSVPGGGAVTEEPLLPGYKVDTCSTGHTLIRRNPVVTDDELGLFAERGLEYVDPDPVAHVVFPDGEHMTMWLDADRTAAEIERFSRADAAAYRRVLAEYADIAGVFAQGRFQPVGMGPTLQEGLSGHPMGRIWTRRLALSAWDIIRIEFEEPHVRSFMMWMASQTGMDIGVPGTGELAYSVLCGRQKNSWSIPIGGSGQLVTALVEMIESHGGTVLCDRTVKSLIIEDGRCTGVETTDGEHYMARKAVVSTIHVKHLIEMAPPECWPPEFHYGVKTYDVGMPVLGMYLLTTAPPIFEHPDGPGSAVSAGYAGWPDDMLRFLWNVRNGRWMTEFAWLLVATPTLADPSRTPPGHHTVKILSPQAYEPPTGVSPERARDEFADRMLAFASSIAPNLRDEFILARMVKGPHDYEQQNLHMIHGAFHGGDRGIAQSGANRPVPGWAQHRMPIKGLYQTGGTTHPGGSITGVPGRNAARILLGDLGYDVDQVLAPMTARQS
jgi:phytoene dehydrogenase-like protein